MGHLYYEDKLFSGGAFQRRDIAAVYYETELLYPHTQTVLTVDTSISNSVTLRGCAGKRISWGDGHHEEGAGESTTHTYGETGEYQVVIHDIGAIPNQFIRGKANVVAATLPSSITHVGEFAFENCINLEMEVNLPNLENLSICAFANCKKITKIVSLGKITEINGYSGEPGGWGAFDKCYSLKEVNLPETLVLIGFKAFSNCSALETVRLYSTTPPLLENAAFTNNDADRTFYVPAGSLSSYQSEANWSEYAESMIEF